MIVCPYCKKQAHLVQEKVPIGGRSQWAVCIKCRDCNAPLTILSRDAVAAAEAARDVLEKRFDDLDYKVRDLRKQLIGR